MSLQKVFPAQKFTPSYWAVSQMSHLSLRALGLHTYLMSLPDGWDISCARIAHARTEGRDAVRNALKELRAAGLAETVVERDQDGTVRTVTRIYAVPQESLKPQLTPGTDFQAPGKTPAHTGDGFTGAGKSGARSIRPLREKTPRDRSLPPLPQQRHDASTAEHAERGRDIGHQEKPPPPTAVATTAPAPSADALDIVENLPWGNDWRRRPTKNHLSDLATCLDAACHEGWKLPDLRTYCAAALRDSYSRTQKGRITYLQRALTDYLPIAPRANTQNSPVKASQIPADAQTPTPTTSHTPPAVLEAVQSAIQIADIGSLTPYTRACFVAIAEHHHHNGTPHTELVNALAHILTAAYSSTNPNKALHKTLVQLQQEQSVTFGHESNKESVTV